ncbi:Ewing's tumor-associated antigen 1 -like protein [Channa argus]|uniref:Ewing's tumor-associated antigen 1-like protein n=1 Tax=Channa argus TaxID=215402 RepID=A0A6G1PD48_CHAAH|nr:Ewing's tumor-associated antigen 1 -like protein [Channa argus]KAK2918401.1 hypothetical protein Q8A73_002772 [Channa argus]
MNRGRRHFDSQEPEAPRPKPNRLSRSFRQTQTAAEGDSPKSQKSDFKTPTRIPRSRVVAGFSGESPHNDSDFQQDIIWDTTSPSPNRPGKRGKKYGTGLVDISEIVSRIAPKHGRPEVAEPTLQQWIGDSATIPCTPDVQVPKPKKKSPRPNGVDDLLKLAKQFDFNMFCRDEEEVEDMHQQSLEHLTEHVLDFENDNQNDGSALLPGIGQAVVNAAAGTDVQKHLDQQMDNDLDFLFDGPTQHISRNLSQAPSPQRSQVKLIPSQPSGKLSSHGPDLGASAANSKSPSANYEFEDDWDNDDLLNDSLVLEMTQNPHNFSAPKHCSTQKLATEVKYQTPTNIPIRLDQSAVTKVEKEIVRQRTTFKLESNPNFSVKGNHKDTWMNTKEESSSKAAEKHSQPSRFLSSNGCSVEVGPQRQTHQSNRAKSDPQKSQFYHVTSGSSSVFASAVTNSFSAKKAQGFLNKHEVISCHNEAPAVHDFLDDDLDSFFLCDLGWDDPAEDNLLCEMCEDVENQIQSVDNMSIKQTVPGLQVGKQRATLQPSNRTWDDRNQHFSYGGGGAVLRDLGREASCSLAGGSASNVAAGKQVKGSFRCTQSITTSGSTSSSTCLQGSSRVASAAAAPRSTVKDQVTFKRPNNPVGNKAVAKCSAAEIELKKQQAMERRRQRLQATQNLRALT